MDALLRFVSRSFAPAELGRLGERRAAWFYRLRAYRVVAMNVETSDGEIDLIVRRGRTFVFVEVKARQQRIAGAPFEAVDRRKQLQIGTLAERWLAAQKMRDAQVRFDVVSLFWNGWRFEVQHFPSAFEMRSEAGRPWVKK
jgi:putative endonuclease